MFCAFDGPLRIVRQRWARNRGEEGLAAYRADRNAASIDGLPALIPAAEPRAPG